ncbi:MAG: LemA family protein, partial [Candidatus Zixiibacteriota bacterium]
KCEALYTDLLTQLEGTENRIAQERRTFNEAVRAYNSYRQKGAGALIAGTVFGFPYEKQFFAASIEAQEAPQVKDLFQSE